MKNKNNDFNSNMKLSEFVSVYYETVSTMKPHSIYAYEHAFAKNVYPFLQDPAVKDVTAPEIEKLITHLEKNHASITSWSHFRELRKIYRYGVKIGVLESNPFEKIKYHYHRPSKGPFTATELNKIMEAVKENPLSDLYLLALDTGMPLSEMLPLTWSDIDFENKLIHIHHRLKGTSSQRSIIDVTDKNIYYDLTPDMETLLENRMRSLNGEKNPDQLVFSHKNNLLLPYRIIISSNLKMKEQTGIKDFNFQRIRMHVKYS